jgi:agmatinase
MDRVSHPAAEGGEAEYPAAARAERLLLSPAMHVEQSDPQAATIYLSSSGARLRVPRALYDLLLRFETPRYLTEVVRGERQEAALAKLRDKGFLVAEGEAERSVPLRLLTDPPVRLFDCPAYKPGSASAEVAVIGVPYDLSDTAAAGARVGPAAIRETSLQTLYGLDRLTGRPRGWFDADLGRPILAGITIGDCGDVFVDPGERQAQLFARITEVLDKVATAGSLPVLLGGDGAISFPAVAALQARAPLAVIRIGGAGLYRSSGPGTFVSPASLAAQALAMPQVSRWLEIGVCGSTDGGVPGFETLSLARLRREGAAALDECLGDARRVYVSLDLASLAQPGDPGHAGDECDRFGYPELHSLIHEIGTRHIIAGMDVVGANPLRPGWNASAMTAVHLLLTGLSAAKDGHPAESLR